MVTAAVHTEEWRALLTMTETAAFEQHTAHRDEVSKLEQDTDNIMRQAVNERDQLTDLLNEERTMHMQFHDAYDQYSTNSQECIGRIIREEAQAAASFRHEITSMRYHETGASMQDKSELRKAVIDRDEAESEQRVFETQFNKRYRWNNHS